MNSTPIDGIQLETVHLPGPPDRAPLVFLHEGLGSVSMWQQRGQDWPRELCAATGRAGWVYSRRGHGQSDPVADVRGPSRWQGGWHVGRHEPDYMHLEAFNVLPTLLAAWGVERPVLVGHSDGASIALLHASRHPVSACVVLAPHVFVEEVALNAIAQARNAYLPDATGNAQFSKSLEEGSCRPWTAIEAQEIEVEESEVEETYARVARQSFGQDPKALDSYLEWKTVCAVL